MAGDPLFLGFDASTQALKCSLLSESLQVLGELEVRFDADLPHYHTKGGVLTGPEGSGQVYSPVAMCVEAMDMLCRRIHEARWNLSDVKAVSASGQQHASVYWSRQAPDLLSHLDANRTLTEQLVPHAFSHPRVPNWQDASTTPQCRALESAVGGADRLATITGSKAHERFTAAQINKLRQSRPEEYHATHRISLVSSFMTTLLCADGEIKGIDESDACGMNIWDMSSPQRGWHAGVLRHISGAQTEDSDEVAELARKLGHVETDGGRVVGRIGRWYRERFGFSDECVVCPGTGDNPATFLSFALQSSEGIISLGTSDTVMVATSSYMPHAEYHTFFHPAQIAPPSAQDLERGKSSTSNAEGNAQTTEALRYFNMLVYKNGSLARENVRDASCNGSWALFDEALRRFAPKGVDQRPKSMGFYWYRPDIIPDGASGLHRFRLVDAADADTAERVETFDVGEHEDETGKTTAITRTGGSREARAIVESQFLNYRARSSAILSGSGGGGGAEASEAGGAAVAKFASTRTPTTEARLARLYATGGAARNPELLQALADILGCDVLKPIVPSTSGGSAGKSGAREGLAGGAYSIADFNACSVAAAMKARWAWERLQRQRGGQKSEAGKDQSTADAPLSFEACIRACRSSSKATSAPKAATTASSSGSANSRVGSDIDIQNMAAVVARPRADVASAYDDTTLRVWRQLEQRALVEGRLRMVKA